MTTTAQGHPSPNSRPILIVGSIALDDVKTPVTERKNLLGGSASYAALGASLFSPVNLVGIVGLDFPSEHIELFQQRHIDLSGLQRVEGETFRWSGEYMENMNERETLSIALNVFEDFRPDLPPVYETTPFVLLGNIAPSLQSLVLDQVKDPILTIADTMDLWIQTTREDLDRLVARVDVLILNDSEADLLTGHRNPIKAAETILARGPKYVCVKKGEHGAILVGKNEGEFFSTSAYPIQDVLDPTGAGDTFAGGFAGYLASSEQQTPSFADMRQAVVYGTALASYNVESFSAEKIRTLQRPDVEKRVTELRAITQF